MAAVRDVEQLSDPQELEWLPARKGTPLSEDTVKARMHALNRLATESERRNAEDAHEEGTGYLELYMRLAERSTGHRSFRRFVRACAKRTPRAVYLRMRIAKAFTREQAAKFGISACTVIVRILEHKKLLQLEQLEGVRLRTTLKSGWTTIHGTVRELRSALRLMKKRAASRGRRLADRDDAARWEELARTHNERQTEDGRLQVRITPGQGGTRVAFDGLDTPARIASARQLLQKLRTDFQQTARRPASARRPVARPASAPRPDGRPASARRPVRRAAIRRSPPEQPGASPH